MKAETTTWPTERRLEVASAYNQEHDTANRARGSKALQEPARNAPLDKNRAHPSSSPQQKQSGDVVWAGQGVGYSLVPDGVPGVGLGGERGRQRKQHLAGPILDDRGQMHHAL